MLQPRSEPIYAKDGSGRVVGGRSVTASGAQMVAVNLNEIDMRVTPQCATRLKELDRNNPFRHYPMGAPPRIFWYRR